MPDRVSKLKVAARVYAPPMITAPPTADDHGAADGRRPGGAAYRTDKPRAAEAAKPPKPKLRGVRS